MQKLQAEHAAWLKAEFPNQPLEHPAAGMVEEAAELLHCVLKQEQEAKYGQHPRHPTCELQADLYDAIGDCLIYCCSYCNAGGYDLQAVWYRYESREGSKLSAAVRVVSIATSIAAIKQGENAAELLTSYIAAVKTVALQHGIDAELAMKSVWQEVKQRKRRPDSPVCPLCTEVVSSVTKLIQTDVGVTYRCPFHGVVGMRFDAMTPPDRSALCLG